MALGEEFIIAIQIFVALLVAYFVALWLALVVWAYRDSHSRSRDPVAPIFAMLLVFIFNIPGVLIYLLARPPETIAEKYDRSLEEQTLLQELGKPAACPTCKRGIQPDYLICPYCRTRLKQSCPRCSRVLEVNWRVCPFCTASLPGESPSEIVSERAQQAGPVSGVTLDPRSPSGPPSGSAPRATPQSGAPSPGA
ncbi:MAG: hypothetical protein HW403_330 [Dehalococcoidia bacterium]|nr:hypothetical protein [Dehalococcoidia bacterium]